MTSMDVTTDSRLCQQCGNAIEEGRSRNKAPTEAKYCLKCRAARRRRANLKYVWRPEYDEYLKAHYYGGLNRRFQVLNRMIRETGLPRWYIKRRAARLGLTMHQDRHPWTAEEVEIVERLLGKVSALTIAKRLKRTAVSVVLKSSAWDCPGECGTATRCEISRTASARTTTKSNGGTVD